MIQAILSLFNGAGDAPASGRPAPAGFDAALLSVMHPGERPGARPKVGAPSPDPELARLAPELRARLERVIARMRGEFGHDVRVVEGWRSAARQDYLFAQGRSRPGPVVTWTRDSAHELGHAADLMVNGGYGDLEAYRTLQRIAREEGLATLGLRDPGHVELPCSTAGRQATDPTILAAAPRPSRDPVDTPSPARSARVAQVAQVAQVARVAQVAQVARVAVPGATTRPAATNAAGPGTPIGEPAPTGAQGVTPRAGSPVPGTGTHSLAAPAAPRAPGARPETDEPIRDGRRTPDGAVQAGTPVAAASPSASETVAGAGSEPVASADVRPGAGTGTGGAVPAAAGADPERIAGPVSPPADAAGAGRAPAPEPAPATGDLRYRAVMEHTAQPRTDARAQAARNPADPVATTAAPATERAMLAAEVVDRVRAGSRTGRVAPTRASDTRAGSADRPAFEAFHAARTAPAVDRPEDRVARVTDRRLQTDPARSAEPRSQESRPAPAPRQAESAATTLRQAGPANPIPFGDVASRSAGDGAGRSPVRAEPQRRSVRPTGEREPAPSAERASGTPATERASTAFAPEQGRAGASAEPTSPRPIADPGPGAEPGPARSAAPTGSAGATERVDVAGRVDAVDAVRARSEAQPLRRVSLRVGEGHDAARVRVDLQGDTVRADMDTRSSRLAHQMGKELSELTRALERQGVDLEGLRVRQGERVVADVSVSRATAESRATEPGSSSRNEGAGTQRHAQEGRDRRRERNQEGNE